MRNGYKSVAIVTIAANILIGCGGKADRAAEKPNPRRSQSVLTAGYTALESQQYNDAIAKADEFLASTPHGPGSAEALYLKGRGFEGKTAGDASEAKANLQSARTAYIAALGQNPKPPLEAYIRTSLANVAYFQDDYQTAAVQGSAAYDKLDRPDVKAWTLYRVGLSQQRLGEFDQADRTFAAVQEQHGNTVPAQRAREHQGARAFYVQLATFASSTSADRAVADLRRQGVAANRVADSQGRSLLRIGPIASYSQAQYFRTRFLQQYPDALVVP